MKCAEVLSVLDDFFDQELPTQEQKLVEIHLQQCASCQAPYQSLQGLRKCVQALPQPNPPPFLESAILRELQLQKTPSYAKHAAGFRFFAAAIVLIGVTIFISSPLLTPRPKASMSSPSTIAKSKERSYENTLEKESDMGIAAGSAQPENKVPSVAEANRSRKHPQKAKKAGRLDGDPAKSVETANAVEEYEMFAEEDEEDYEEQHAQQEKMNVKSKKKDIAQTSDHFSDELKKLQGGPIAFEEQAVTEQKAGNSRNPDVVSPTSIAKSSVKSEKESRRELKSEDQKQNIPISFEGSSEELRALVETYDGIFLQETPSKMVISLQAEFFDDFTKNVVSRQEPRSLETLFFWLPESDKTPISLFLVPSTTPPMKVAEESKMNEAAGDASDKK